MKLIYSYIFCEIQKRINFTFFIASNCFFFKFNNHYYLIQNYPLVLDMLWTYLVLFFPDLAKFFQILIFSNFFYLLLLLFHYKPDPWCIFLGKNYKNKSIMYILLESKLISKLTLTQHFQFVPYQYLNFEILILLQ